MGYTISEANSQSSRLSVDGSQASLDGADLAESSRGNDFSAMTSCSQYEAAAASPLAKHSMITPDF